jgi:hypothetical protein
LNFQRYVAVMNSHSVNHAGPVLMFVTTISKL